MSLEPQWMLAHIRQCSKVSQGQLVNPPEVVVPAHKGRADGKWSRLLKVLIER
jgi:hypothetical protein